MKGPPRVTITATTPAIIAKAITITIINPAIPFLFLGSLLLERFFGIPGLGYLMIDAIGARDFQVINAMTYIGAILFVVFNLITDICYSLVDPRVSLD